MQHRSRSTAIATCLLDISHATGNRHPLVSCNSLCTGLGHCACPNECTNSPFNSLDPLIACVYVVIRVIFFFAVNARNKKTVWSCNFFFPAVTAYTTYSKKKKLHDLTVFLLRAFTAKKKNYTTYSKKKDYTTIRFFCYAHLQRKKKITRLTAKKKNYTT